MQMPKSYTFVRHGESEANRALRDAERGDTEALRALQGKVDAGASLTEHGKEQARRTGAWLKSLQRPYFDKYVTTSFRRGMQTAYHLDLPQARWDFDVRMREISWGDMEYMLPLDQKSRWSDFEALYQEHPFHHRPVGGESFAQAIDRVFPMLEYMGREYSDCDILCVGHYQLIQVAQIIIEHISEHDFKQCKEDLGLKNCDAVLYRKEEYGLLKCFYRNETNEVTPWHAVNRRIYSNQDLGTILYGKS